MKFNLLKYRLINQNISTPDFDLPEQVVSWFGAMQAQDYPGALWSVGLRMKRSTETMVEKAIAERKIVRTWPMRGTLHFVAAEDTRWILQLLAHKIVKGNLARLKRMGLDEKIFTKSKKALESALAGGNIFTREEMYGLLFRAGIKIKDQQGIHILWKLAQEGFLCFGPKQGKQYTFVLLDEWVPAYKKITREEALRKITHRYFTSHGPATLRDFAWWTGLNLSEATNGIEEIKTDLLHEKINGNTYWFTETSSKNKGVTNTIYLLPGFDEYMVAYKDRNDILDPLLSKQAFAGLVTPKIIIDGVIRGSWKRIISKDKIIVEASLYDRVHDNLIYLIEKSTKKYGEFMNCDILMKLN